MNTATQNVFHMDYETFSTADLKKVGAFRYANDPSTEVLCMGLALGDAEPVVWRADGKWKSQTELLKFMEWMDLLEADTDALIYAHNALFEIAITNALWVKTFKRSLPSVKQWRCTAAMAKRAALPKKLETLAETLALTELKDNKGAALIRLFSILNKTRKSKTQAGGETFRILPQHQPEKFDDFVEYCRQDVCVERLVHKTLEKFELKGMPLASFQLDIDINMRGLPVNLVALHNAQKIIDEVQSKSAEEFYQITGFQVTQREMLLKWLQARGYKGEKLTASIVDEALDAEAQEESDDIPFFTGNMTSEAVRALTLRKNVSYAAVKKVSAMIACAGPHDNKVRGTLEWHGPTTGRWAGRLIQPQNFKRPTVKDHESAYRDICDGANATYLRLAYGEPLEVISSCIRHFIHDLDGPLFDADYAAIEARIVCWLADEQEALTEYRNGVDRYVRMASIIYSEAESNISKDQRFVGKQAVLGCGFQLGANGFVKGCAKYGVEVSFELAEITVNAFRARHKKLVALWYQAERACKAAINAPNTSFKIGKHCSVFTTDTAGMKFMLIRLPSGRLLSYPKPAIEDDRITFFGQPPLGSKWCRISTYGGSIIENITQAVAADVMTNGAIKTEAQNYKIAALIHDQALAYTTGRNQSIEEFVRLLTDLPAWANGLPIEAEGKIAEFYSK